MQILEKSHDCSGLITNALEETAMQSPALLEEWIHELRITLSLFQRQKTNQKEYNVHLGVKL